jgi:hypothetical protein
MQSDRYNSGITKKLTAAGSDRPNHINVNHTQKTSSAQATTPFPTFTVLIPLHLLNTTRPGSQNYYLSVLPLQLTSLTWAVAAATPFL